MTSGNRGSTPVTCARCWNSGNPSQAIKSHVDAEDLQKLEALTAGGRQRQNHVNESGIYALILCSTKDSAKRFKRWVTHEVLPAIRKTGAYGTPAPVDPLQDLTEFREAPLAPSAAWASCSGSCSGQRHPKQARRVVRLARRTRPTVRYVQRPTRRPSPTTASAGRPRTAKDAAQLPHVEQPAARVLRCPPQRAPQFAVQLGRGLAPLGDIVHPCRARRENGATRAPAPAPARKGRRSRRGASTFR